MRADGSRAHADSHTHRDLIAGKDRGGEVIKEPEAGKGSAEVQKAVEATPSPSPTPSPTTAAPSPTPSPTPAPTAAPVVVATTAPAKADDDSGITDLDKHYIPTR